MISYKEKVKGSLFISSFLETIAFFNGIWEFNYGKTINSVKDGIIMNYFFINHFQMLGGIENLNMSIYKSSDDTILILATLEAVLNGGGEINYINSYLKYYPKLKEEIRKSGLGTLNSLEKLRVNRSIKAIEYNSNLGGNGCAIRTGPIGLLYHDDIDKVCEEALIASLTTHHYPLGYLGGIVSALFTYFAINDINPFLWSLRLVEMYETKYFHKIIAKYSEVNNKIDDYFIYWKKYNELRLSKMEYRNLPIFLNPIDKINDYLQYSSVQYLTKSKGYDRLGGSGLEGPIIAYDNFLLSAIPDNKMKINIKNPIFDWNTFIYNNIFFFGDNDSISAISGFWFGAYNGLDKCPIDKVEKLEFFSELNNLIKKFK